MQVGSIETTLSADARQFNAAMRSAQNSFRQTTQVIAGGAQQGVSSMKQMQSAIQNVEVAVNKMRMTFTRAMAAIGAGFIIPSVLRAANGAIMGFNQQLDSAKIAMESFLGSQDKADKMLDTLQEFAARTPFNFSDLLGTSQQMLAMGVAADELIPRLRAIGDAAAAMGGSPEVMYRIQRALGQITAKGRAQAEELMQLAEVGIPAYEYIAQLTGGDIPAALDAMRKGQIDAASAVSALLDGLNRDFEGMMDKQSKTMQGALSTVQDYAEMTVGALGRPLFDAVRETMLKITDFLSSEEVAKGTARFAQNFANALKTAGEIGGQLLREVGPALTSALTAAYEAGRAFFNGLDEIKMALAPMGAAVVGLAKAVELLSTFLTPLLRLISDNEVAVAMFATAITVLIAKKRLLGVTADGNAKRLQRVVDAFKNGVTSAKEYQAQINSTNATFRNSGQAAGAFGVAVKGGMAAAKAAVVSFAASTGVLLAITAAVTALSKAFQAFADRNKDMTERTNELTKALESNTNALLDNADALKGGADGANLLGEAILTTGEGAEKITKSFGELGMAASMDSLMELTTNFDDVAKSILLAKGATDEEAAAIIRLVNGYDKQNGSITDAIRSNLLFKDATGLSADSANTYARALEELQDQIENIDFESLVYDQAKVLVGSGRISQQLVDETRAWLENTLAYHDADEAARAFMFNQELMRRVMAETREEMAMMEEAQGLVEWAQMLGDVLAPMNNQLKTTEERFNALAPAANETAISIEQYIQELIGAKAAHVDLERAFFDNRMSINAFMTDVANLGGSLDELTGAGYKLYDQFVSLGTMMRNANKSFEETSYAQAELVTAFIASAQQAGYTKDKIDSLIKSLGILDGLSTEMKLLLTMDTSQLKQAIAALESSIFAYGFGGGQPPKALYDMLKQARDLVSAFEGTLTTPSRVGGFVPGIPEREVASGAQGVADALDEAQKIMQDAFDYFIEGVTTLGNVAVSQDFAQALLGTPEEITAAIENLLEIARQYGISNIPDVQDALLGVLDKRDTLIQYANDRIRLVEQLTDAENELASAMSNRQYVLEQAQAFDAGYFSDERFGIERSRLEQLMASISDAQSQMFQAESELATLESQRLSYSTSLASSLTQGISTGRGGVLYQARRILEHAREFRDNLTDLSKKGYPVDLIAQVAQLGAIEGNKLANKLLALSPSDLAEFKSLYAEIQKVAAEGAEVAASVLFDADIAGARGEIDRQRSLVRSLFDQALAEANALAMGANDRVQELSNALDANSRASQALVTGIQTEFGSFIQRFVQSQGTLTDGMQSVFNEFLVNFSELITRIGSGEAAVRNPVVTPTPTPTNPIAPTPSPSPTPPDTSWLYDPTRPPPVPTGLEGFVWRFDPSRGQWLRVRDTSWLYDPSQPPPVPTGMEGYEWRWNQDRSQWVRVLQRQRGGITRSGVPYLVGEKGPELFVPQQLGSIVPNDMLAMSGGGGGVSNYSVNVTVNGRGDGDEIGRQVVRAIQEFERRNGNKWRA